MPLSFSTRLYEPHSLSAPCMNLTMKLVPLYSDCLPSAEQDAICCTITKQALCLAEFKFVSNPHINLIDKPSAKLHNHSLCTIVLAYHHNGKKRPSSPLTMIITLAKSS